MTSISNHNNNNYNKKKRDKNRDKNGKKLEDNGKPKQRTATKRIKTAIDINGKHKSLRKCSSVK